MHGPTALLIGLSGPEAAIIVGIIVLLFGATRIPALLRTLGRSQSEFKRGRMEADQEEAILREAQKLGIVTEGKSLEQVQADVTTARRKG